MAVEFAPMSDRGRIAPISWPAVFASLAVGISVMLLLTLAGVAVGISIVEPGADSPRAITIGAATWQTISMLIAALVGGYVAARLSGLRRTTCCLRIPSSAAPVWRSIPACPRTGPAWLRLHDDDAPEALAYGLIDAIR